MTSSSASSSAPDNNNNPTSSTSFYSPNNPGDFLSQLRQELANSSLSASASKKTASTTNTTTTTSSKTTTNATPSNSQQDDMNDFIRSSRDPLYLGPDGNDDTIGDDEYDDDHEELLREMALADESKVRFCLYRGTSHDADAKSTDSLAFRARLWHHLTARKSQYFWHFQQPQFEFASSPTDSQPLVKGHFDFQEDITDEWFFAKQLFEYTRKLDRDCAAEVEDADGEYLLIESALHLPEWLEPDTATNRCFIHRGQLHIVPIELGPMETPQQGVDVILSASRGEKKVNTTASGEAQNDLRKRFALSGVDKTPHHARVKLPLDVARILHKDPRILSFAANAFFYREAEWPTLSKKFMPANFETVQMMIPFTRCLYAQFHQQELFYSDEVDVPKEFQCTERKHPDYLANDIGLKITMGMDLLYKDDLTIEHINLVKLECLMEETNFETNDNYLKFVSQLKELNYLHTEQDERERRQLFIIMDHKMYCEKISMHDYIDELLKDLNEKDHISAAAADFQKRLPEVTKDDSLDWLGDESELDAMMKFKMEQQEAFDRKHGGKSTHADAQEEAMMRQFADMFMAGMQGFMSGESGIDGVDPGDIDEIMREVQRTGDFFPGADDDEDDDDDEGYLDDEILEAYGAMDEELLQYPGIGGERQQSQDPQYLMRQFLRAHQAETDVGGVGPLNSMLSSMGMHLPRADDFIGDGSDIVGDSLSSDDSDEGEETKNRDQF